MNNYIISFLILSSFYFFNCNNIKYDRYILQNKSKYIKENHLNINDSSINTIPLLENANETKGIQKNDLNLISIKEEVNQIKKAKQKNDLNKYKEYFISNEGFKVYFYEDKEIKKRLL